MVGAFESEVAQRGELGLDRALAVTDPVVEPAGRQVEAGDQVSDAVITVVGDPLLGWLTVGFPGLAGPRLQVQRPELVDTDNADAGGRAIVEGPGSGAACR